MENRNDVDGDSDEDEYGSGDDDNDGGDNDENEVAGQNIIWNTVQGQFFPDPLPNFQQPGRRGVLINTDNYEVSDYFDELFPPEVFRIISRETNRFAEQVLEERNLSGKSRFHSWKETSENEIQTYIAIEIGMSVCAKPTIASYWSTNWLNHTPNYHMVMPRDRYEMIRSMLHFANNEELIPQGEDGYDPLFKVRKVLDEVDQNNERVYSPDRDLAIDESIRLFKGRSILKTYNPKKPVKWGLKEYILCESDSSFVLRKIPYVGKYTTDVADGRLTTEQIVHDLLPNRYHNKGHIVYMDNYYSSVKLFRELMENKIGACGTINKTRKGFPEELKNVQLNKGDQPAFRSSNTLLVCSWQDTKRVNMLSTVSTNDTVQKQV